MAHQVPTSQQAQYPGPMSQQHQNIGQHRHAPNGQQHSYGQSIPARSTHSIPDTSQGPLLVSFIVEKPRNATSWEDAVPEQQHVTVHDLKKEVHKFRRNHNSVKKALNEITSPNCRRIINELVEEQNVALAKLNPAMEYRIASVVNKFREHKSLGRREKHLVRVDVILEAEDTGLQGQAMGFEMTGNGQDPNRAKQFNAQLRPQDQINGASQNMPAQPQMPRPQHQPPHNMAPPPPSEPRAQPPLNLGNPPAPPPPRPHPELSRAQPLPSQGHPPPPPPPPPMGGGMNGQPPMAGPPAPPPPPPPPVGGGHPAMSGPHVHPPPMQHRSSQGFSGIPAGYAGAMPMPRPVPVNGTMNPEFLKSQNAKYRSHTDTSSLYSGSDVSWEDESGSSFVDVESVTHRDMSGREHERGRHARKSRRNPKHRVHSRSKRSMRSRSRSRPRRGVHESHAQTPERRHRTDRSFDDGHNVKRSPATSGSSSPEPLHAKLSGQVPANIHIHMNTNTGEDRTRSGNASPADLYNEKRKSAKGYTSHDDISEASWDRASGTESWQTTSGHTADDGIWDLPQRHQSSRRKASPGARPSEAYDAQRPSYHHHADTRPAPRPRYAREPSNEHIPARPSPRPRSRSRDPPYFDHHQTHHHHQQHARPDLSHRRTAPTMPPRSPHTNAFTPPPPPPPPPSRPIRAFSFTREPAYPPRRSHRAHAEPREEQINLRDLREALDWVYERNREKEDEVRYAGGRRGQRDSGVYEDDEWDVDAGLGRRRAGY